MTVMENILLAPCKALGTKKEDAKAEAETLLRRVGLWEKRDSYPRELSGGQKQRILIARALVAHPDILILDDSSSALDYRTDASLRKELGEHFKDTTTIMIAQRISSIRHADHIMVLEQGHIIGYGTHEELMESCELYQEIGRSQLGNGGEINGSRE